jgi:hypothetical protein
LGTAAAATANTALAASVAATQAALQAANAAAAARDASQLASTQAATAAANSAAVNAAAGLTAANLKLQALVDKPAPVLPASTCGGAGQPDCNPFVSPGAGTMPTHAGSWYTAKYPDGLRGVWDSRKAALFATPLGAAIANMAVPVGSGSYPTWTLDLNMGMGGHGNLGTHVLSVPGWIWDVAKVIMLLSAAFLCRRIIFGG